MHLMQPANKEQNILKKYSGMVAVVNSNQLCLLLEMFYHWWFHEQMNNAINYKPHYKAG